MYLKRFFKLFEKRAGGEKSVLAEALWVCACAIAGTDPDAQASLQRFLAVHGLYEPDGTTHPTNVVDWALQVNDPRGWSVPDLEAAPHQQSHLLPPDDVDVMVVATCDCSECEDDTRC